LSSYEQASERKGGPQAKLGPAESELRHAPKV
jgi:hypothetical protein